jgi:hypothetical protein
MAFGPVPKNEVLEQLHFIPARFLIFLPIVRGFVGFNVLYILLPGIVKFSVSRTESPRAYKVFGVWSKWF